MKCVNMNKLQKLRELHDSLLGIKGEASEISIEATVVLEEARRKVFELLMIETREYFDEYEQLRAKLIDQNSISKEK